MRYRFKKKAEFDADFESIAKVAKRPMRIKVISKKGTKNGVLTFITVRKSFEFFAFF
jgi:hypothetical protein